MKWFRRVSVHAASLIPVPPGGRRRISSPSRGGRASRMASRDQAVASRSSLAWRLVWLIVSWPPPIWPVRPPACGCRSGSIWNPRQSQCRGSSWMTYIVLGFEPAACQVLSSILAMRPVFTKRHVVAFLFGVGCTLPAIPPSRALSDVVYLEPFRPGASRIALRRHWPKFPADADVCYVAAGLRGLLCSRLATMQILWACNGFSTICVASDLQPLLR